jgi:hypothetical protein
MKKVQGAEVPARPRSSQEQLRTQVQTKAMDVKRSIPLASMEAPPPLNLLQVCSPVGWEVLIFEKEKDQQIDALLNQMSSMQEELQKRSGFSYLYVTSCKRAHAATSTRKECRAEEKSWHTAG